MAGSVSRDETPVHAAVSFRRCGHLFVQEDRVVEAIREVTVEVPPGQFVAIVGPSGCGKTTLLSMVAGLLRPHRGEVLLGGKIPAASSRQVGYMLARDALLPWRTAIGNVMLGLEIRGVPAAERRLRAKDWLRRVGLAEFADSRISQLSQGMRQRVAIARSLVINPSCILMDEPFAALDAQTRIVAQQEFIGLWERERPTVLLVTHDLGEAVLLADRVILLSQRPSTILMDVTIELPRPRDSEAVRNDSAFLRYYDMLWRQLRELVSSGS